MFVRYALCLTLLCFAFIGLSEPAQAYTGVASYYELTGNYTASADLLERDDFTCASPLNLDGTPVYPFGTVLGITYKGRYAECIVTDTGSFGVWGRDVDLNIAVAEYLGLAPLVGVDYVDIQIVGYDDGWYYGKQY